MSIVTFNPYPLLGSQFTNGMDTISGSLNPASTVDDLVNAIYNYVQPLYYPSSSGAVSTATEVELRSVIYNIINAYSDKVISRLPWTEQQVSFISMMLGYVTTSDTPINALGTWLLDIQDTISEAELTIDEQTPLQLGIEFGRTVYTYWNTKVTTPGTWAPFFQAPAALNYANIPLWTAACMQGALIGSNATRKGLIAPSTSLTTENIVSSLIGALAIGAGKVIFKWVPEITPRDLVLGANGFADGGFSPAMQTGLYAKEEKKTNKKDCIVSNNCDHGNCVYACSLKDE